ncbi:MAG: hypothetical protein NTY90_02265 [Candidatus Micrarchaeota archaeon]|nr:hypothetical protein [Candidatus Micrarchaeota archaeon]
MPVESGFIKTRAPNSRLWLLKDSGLKITAQHLEGAERTPFTAATRQILFFSLPKGEKLVAKERRTKGWGTEIGTRRRVEWSVSRGFLEEMRKTQAFKALTGIPFEKPVGIFIERQPGKKPAAYTLFAHEKGVILSPEVLEKMDVGEKQKILKKIVERVGKVHSKHAYFGDFKFENIMYDRKSRGVTFLDAEDARAIDSRLLVTPEHRLHFVDLLTTELARVVLMAAQYGLLEMNEKKIDEVFENYAPNISHLFRDAALQAESGGGQKLSRQELITQFIRQETLRKTLGFVRGTPPKT